MKSSKQMTVGILIFDEVEILDCCGPFEVFASASSGKNDGGQDRLFQVVTVAERTAIVRCRGGLLVQPNHTFENHPPLDILVVPGGYGTRIEIKNSRLIDWIRSQHAHLAITTSVCTGASLLAQAGLLDERRVTTHWSTIEELQSAFPKLHVVDDERVIDTGKIITSAGVSAGIDMALHVVERLHGRNIAATTARDMEYEWSPLGRNAGT